MRRGCFGAESGFLKFLGEWGRIVLVVFDVYGFDKF